MRRKKYENPIMDAIAAAHRRVVDNFGRSDYNADSSPVAARRYYDKAKEAEAELGTLLVRLDAVVSRARRAHDALDRLLGDTDPSEGNESFEDRAACELALALRELDEEASGQQGA